MRPDKDQYYLGIAKAVSARSTCMRRQYGAVIVKDDQIIATGYNGAPRGEANCDDNGYCFREATGVPHGEKYELCRAVHAEQNAIIAAPRDKMLGAVLYLWGGENGQKIDAKPCAICEKLIKNAGLTVIS